MVGLLDLAGETTNPSLYNHHLDVQIETTFRVSMCLFSRNLDVSEFSRPITRDDRLANVGRSP